MSLSKFDEKILRIVIGHPEVSGALISAVLEEEWERKWRDTLGDKWARRLAPFCSGSIGGIYVSLAKLEHGGFVRSRWGVATAARGGYRPRHYRATS
jgi:hypothetical protein